MFCAAGGGGEEAQPLSGLQRRRLSESNLLRQLRLVHGASPLAQDGLKGSFKSASSGSTPAPPASNLPASVRSPPRG